MRLLYLRQYFTMHVLGILFDLDAANVCRNIHGLLPVLEQALPAPLRPRTLQAQPDETPGKETKKPRKIRSLDEFLEVFPELTDVVVDGTEQPRGQPKVKKGQRPGKKAVGRPKGKKRFYSVKQGTHTLKTQVTVTPEGQIVHLSATASGPAHDMKVLRCSRLMAWLPRHVRVWGDPGYTDMEKVYPDRETVVPAKRPATSNLRRLVRCASSGGTTPFRFVPDLTHPQGAAGSLSTQLVLRVRGQWHGMSDEHIRNEHVRYD